MQCSRSHVSKLACAAEYAAEVAAGQRARADVPPYLREYLDEGFPLPVAFGPRTIRIPADEFEAWISRRRGRRMADAGR